MLHTLWCADDPRSEQVAIGLGARLGNGLLTCVLAWLLVRDRGGSTSDASAIATVVATLFLVTTASLAARPQRVVIGYKG